ncbi:MAG: DNA internalization-related competence protein ComEC/Rec2 [Gammaproteobacteria bacterium]|nr:DNA internalization-related competence protein ComEC/Rec2 [Gammaproteobacteria bacterium]
MTRTRAFYISVTLFALGTAGAQLTPVLIPAWLSALAGIALAPCLLSSVLRPWSCLALGVLWTLFRADLLLSNEWPARLEGRDALIVGTVSGLPERSERYLKFDLIVEQARFRGERVDFSGRIRIRWYNATPEVSKRLKAGSLWRLQVRLKQPHGYYNPGTFDYEAHLYREGVRATGYVRRSGHNTHLGSSGRWSIQPVRQHLRDRLEAILAGARHPGMLKALAMGDRSAIPDARWESLRRTGTSHLIAISGLHVGFAAGIGALIGLGAGRIMTSFNPAVAAPRVAALSGLVLALLYAVVSGFDVPAQRAFVMAAVFLLGMFWRRHAWNVRGLCLALMAVLVMNPASVHDPGFWLSFSAVALILAWLSARGPAPRRGKVVEAATLQCLLSLGLVPVVAAFFGEAPVVSAPANLVAVPVVMFGIVPLCLTGIVLLGAGFTEPASLVLTLADGILSILCAFLDRLADPRYASVEFRLEVWQALALLAGILWVLAVRTRSRLWGLACGLVLLAPAPPGPTGGEFRLTVLDVGQGLSAVVETERHTLVYDTGPRYPGGFSLADHVLVPYLKWRRTEIVDALVVSHGDNDHRGGYEDLRSAFPVARVLSSVAGDLVDAEYCRRGQRWSWDGVSFDILHPETERPPPHNNASCVLRVTGRYGSALLTGDIEAEAETAVLRTSGIVLDSDVLLVPHQGSRTSSTRPFIDRVDPRWAIVAAGYRNRYGHPHPEIVERYAAREVPLFSTASSGAVVVRVFRNGIRVRGWRELRPRYWLD